MPSGQPGVHTAHLTPCARCGVGERRGGRPYCADCERAMVAASRAADERIQLLREARTGPCVDCGIELPWQCMELDHVRGAKSFGLTQTSVLRRHVRAVAAEIAKCERRCPNCHRLRHYATWQPS